MRVCGWLVIILEWVVVCLPYVLAFFGAVIFYLILSKVWDVWRDFIDEVAQNLDLDCMDDDGNYKEDDNDD